MQSQQQANGMQWRQLWNGNFLMRVFTNITNHISNGNANANATTEKRRYTKNKSQKFCSIDGERKNFVFKYAQPLIMCTKFDVQKFLHSYAEYRTEASSYKMFNFTLSATKTKYGKMRKKSFWTRDKKKKKKKSQRSFVKMPFKYCWNCEIVENPFEGVLTIIDSLIIDSLNYAR